MQETISKELLEKTARQQRSVLQVHKQDNVLIALKDLAKGEQVNYNETTLTVKKISKPVIKSRCVTLKRVRQS